MNYGLMADLALWVHVLWVLFILLGQAAVLVGWGLGWSWTRNLWFRLVHLAAMLVVAIQAWLGIACPLTLMEHALRLRAGDAGYRRSFVSDWLERLLFYTAPGWVFLLLYSLFALLMVLTFAAYPPRRP